MIEVVIQNKSFIIHFPFINCILDLGVSYTMFVLVYETPRSKTQFIMEKWIVSIPGSQSSKYELAVNYDTISLPSSFFKILERCVTKYLNITHGRKYMLFIPISLKPLVLLTAAYPSPNCPCSGPPPQLSCNSPTFITDIFEVLFEELGNFFHSPIPRLRCCCLVSLFLPLFFVLSVASYLAIALSTVRNWKSLLDNVPFIK